MERLSPPLSCRIKPVPVRPVTVPPTVYGPPTPPPPPPPLGFGTPLQAERRTELIKRDTKKVNFSRDFIRVSLLLVPACDGQATANFLKTWLHPVVFVAIAWHDRASDENEDKIAS